VAQNVAAEDEVEGLAVCGNVLDTSLPYLHGVVITQLVDESPRRLDVVTHRVCRNDPAAKALVQRHAVPSIPSADTENRRILTEPE
jgi:hypothetical protein